MYMDSTGGDTFVDPKEKWPVAVPKTRPPPRLSQVRLTSAEIGPFTGTLYKSSWVIDANADPPPARLPATERLRELSVTPPLTMPEVSPTNEEQNAPPGPEPLIEQVAGGNPGSKAELEILKVEIVDG